jgi:hypothetical protein
VAVAAGSSLPVSACAEGRTDVWAALFAALSTTIDEEFGGQGVKRVNATLPVGERIH